MELTWGTFLLCIVVSTVTDRSEHPQNECTLQYQVKIMKGIR